METKRSKADGFMLRFPDGLRERVKAAADENGRSMNTEIVIRLEESLSMSTDEHAAAGEAVRKLQNQNDVLRWNFEVLAQQLAGPVGENREEVIRLMSALRILGRRVPE